MNRKQHFEIQWQGMAVEIRYTPDWLGMMASDSGYGTAHLEINQPERTPLPFTETGYRFCFTSPDDIETAGGPVAYVEQWLDWAAQEPEWQAAQAAARQLVLL
jgi:hypothetical protein